MEAGGEELPDPGSASEDPYTRLGWEIIDFAIRTGVGVYYSVREASSRVGDSYGRWQDAKAEELEAKIAELKARRDGTTVEDI